VEQTKQNLLEIKNKIMESKLSKKEDKNLEHYVIDIGDEVIKIIDQKELDELINEADEYDGFLGFAILGKLIRD